MPAHPLAVAHTQAMLAPSPLPSNKTAHPLRAFFLLSATLFLGSCHRISPAVVSFSQSSSTIQAYDFVEVTANVSLPHASNPFTDAEFNGWFESADHSKRWQGGGFFDSADGRIFRIRFMPSWPGDYTYPLKYHHGWS